MSETRHGCQTYASASAACSRAIRRSSLRLVAAWRDRAGSAKRWAWPFAVAPPRRGKASREYDEEGFLVLRGECLLVIEEQECDLAPGDFVYCPPGTDHILVGAGARACSSCSAPANDTESSSTQANRSRAHAAPVDAETTSPAEAYRESPPWIASRHPRSWAAAQWTCGPPKRRGASVVRPETRSP
jgi:mannose-6-phosphate isomerase-like protein (cupin superfamily)